MLEDRAKHDLQMVEIVAKVNDIPNHVTEYFEKGKINMRRTIFFYQQKARGCKSMSNSIGSEGEIPKNRSVVRISKEEESVGCHPRPLHSPAKVGVDDETTYLGKFKMPEVETSPVLVLNSKMKRKKGEEIPLASLRNDSQSFEKFKGSSGFVVGSFCLTVRVEEEDFKLAQYIFNESLPNG